MHYVIPLVVAIVAIVAIAIAITIVFIYLTLKPTQSTTPSTTPSAIVWVTEPREFKSSGFARYFAGFSNCDIAARVPLKCATPDQYLSQLRRVDAEGADALERAVAIAKTSIGNASKDSLAQKIGVSIGTASRILALLNDPGVPWKVAIFEDLAENGWPHTHADIICIPDLSKIQNLPQTMVHERIHVLQRLHPKFFRDIAIEEWGMRPISLRDFEPRDALDFRRSNPDLDEFLYVGSSGTIAISLFDSEEAARGGLSAATTRFFRRGVEVRDAHEKDEHPYETQAYMIAGSMDYNTLGSNTL